MTRRKDASPTSLDELLARSRSGARTVEQGQFRLDWSRALDKIQRFQLTDPHRYVLELVQSAVAGGASAIEVTTDTDDVIMTYDAPWHPAEELARLFDHLFAQESELTPLKQLALAINAALALEPRFITVDSSDGKTGHRLHLRSHTDLSIEPLPGHALRPGTRVHVRDRLSWKLLVELFRSRTAEGKHLIEGCALAPIPVRLDGKQLNRPFEPDALARRPIRARGMRGEVALPGQARASSAMHICMHGVRVVTIELGEHTALGAAGFVAHVEDPRLVRNASHSDIHRDAAFDHTRSAVEYTARTLLLRWLKATLLDQDPARERSAVERHYLEVCARLLLRGRVKKLAPELDALLDVPDMVELAVRAPRSRAPQRSSLRPVWEAYRKHGACHVATGVYALALADLPDGMVPVRGPAWVARQVFRGAAEDVDAVLADLEIGQKNRRKREAMRREAVLGPGEAMIKVPLGDEAQGIRGELGLVRPSAKVRHEPSAQLKNTHVVEVLFLRDGVPLGEHTFSASLALGTAVVDSPRFEPTHAWDGVALNDAARSVERLIQRATPALLEALYHSFQALPPSVWLLTCGAFTEDGLQERIPADVSAAWPTDALAAAARWHVDMLLARGRKLRRDRAPWLWRWPLFYTLTGQPVSLAQICGEEPVRAPDGAEVVVPREGWSVVADQPWYRTMPEDAWILSISFMHRPILQRYVPGLASGDATLKQHRQALVRRRELEERRRHNLAVAEAHRQAPALRASSYAAILDLVVLGGQGQMGVPRDHALTWLLFLDGDLPLERVELDTPFPVHAVVSSTRIEADEAFAAVRSRVVVDETVHLVRDHLRELADAFAGTPEARTAAGMAHLWSFVASVTPYRENPLWAVPDAVADAPLVATVDRGFISLREVLDDARAHKGAVLVSTQNPGKQLQERPILVCGDKEQRALCRLLGIRVFDYTQALRTEQRVLERMKQGRRQAVLGPRAALTVEVAAEGITGELGVAAAASGPGQESGWVEVLCGGVPVERRPLDIEGMPLVAVVDSAGFKPNHQWTAIVPNRDWKRAMKALSEAAEALVTRALTHAQGATGDDAVVECLRALAGQRFQGRPTLDVDKRAPTTAALAEAAIWQSAGGERERVTLAELAEYCATHGVIWVVGEERGYVAPGRIIVRGGDVTCSALAQIFGTRVSNGARVLARDDAAHRRRMNAPELDTTVSPVLCLEVATVERAFPDLGLEIRGQVALWRDYRSARPGLELHIGADGRLLCVRNVAHALRGVAQVDCRGLKINRDFTGVASTLQLRALDREVQGALWRAVEAALGTAVGLESDSPADEHRRAMFLEALAAATAGQGPGLREPLMAAPLFRTVSGQLVSADALVAHTKKNRRVLVVSDELGRGEPHDGRLIVRAGDAGLAALRAVHGITVERHDQAWRDELAGQLRRKQTPQAQPHLPGDIAVKRYAHEDGTTALVGLIMPGARAAAGDEGDAPSRVHLHIERRKVTERRLPWHPAVEVWLSDDRLTPTADFCDVVADEAYARALAVARAQIPALLAQAAAICLADPTDALRRRLARHVLAHRVELSRKASLAPGGPEARILAVPMWRCLTSAGPDTLSTAALLAAHDDERLVTVRAGAAGQATEQGVVALSATEADIELLRDALGPVRDDTAALEALEARRLFLARAPVAAITLAAIPADEPMLWRHRLIDPGWDGEVGIAMELGHGIEVCVFVEHRRMTTLSLPSATRARVAAEWSGLSVTPAYDDVIDDEALARYRATIQRAVWDTLIELAHHLDELSAGERARATSVLLAALAASREHGAEPAEQRLVDVLLGVPLLADASGRQWSVAALQAHHGAGALIAAISPDTLAAGKSLEDRVILVLGDDDFESTARVLRLIRHDRPYLEGVDARMRMKRAPTTRRLPRKVLAPARVDLGALRGELGLAAKLGPGHLALFSHGRMVEERPYPALSGLIGHVDGPLATDRRFERVELEAAHEAEIERLYDRRLEAAVAQAAAYRGRKSASTWQALRAYVCVYLQRHVDELGRTLTERRDHVLAGGGALPGPLRTAIRLPIFESNDGAWQHLGTVVSGDEPRVVLLPRRERRPPRQPATLLIADQREGALLASILGSRAVLTYERWREELEAARKRETRAQLRRAATAEAHLRSALQSALREAAAHVVSTGLNLTSIAAMQVAGRGKSRLAEQARGSGRILINSGHPLWTATLAGHGRDPGKVWHLAAAVITELAMAGPGLAADDAVAMLAALADAAAP